MESEFYDDNISYGNYSYIDDIYPYKKPYGISLGGQIGLIVIYSLTTLLAIIGNVTVIFVLACSGRSRTDLNTFLINLSVSDVTMAVFGIPFSFVQAMLGHWIFGRGLCKVVVFMQQVSVTASIYTLVAIGVDRFFAVYYPIKKRMSKHSAKFAIAFIWFVSSGLAIVQLVYGITREYQISMTEKLIICDEWWPQQKIGIAYELFIMIITYVIPLCALGLTYFLVGRRLWGRNLPGNAHRNRDMTNSRSKQKVIKMLAIIVCLFAFCWLPLNTLNVLGRFDVHVDKKVIIYFCCHWLAMANSFINPIVYGFLNDSFRTDLRRFLTSCSYGSRRLQLQLAFRSGSRTPSSSTSRRTKSTSSSHSLRALAANECTGRKNTNVVDGQTPGIATVVDLGDKQKHLVFGKPRPDDYFN
ncbi:RYamide receptor-like [Ptychodera flava]|uniref:RYamide receptor-like n=1 Tax=Ptychodera flava TaxID=63121 RepID=UPI003969DC48